MKNVHFAFAPLILICSLLASQTLADENGALKATSSQVTAKLTDEFDQALSDNLVRDTNGVAVVTSEDIVTGLRQGTAFEYQLANGDSQIIDPASGLGYGEVRHALTLSEQNGGDLQSVLDMRESGMGWGEIAQQQGTTLGAAKKQPLTTDITSGSGETTNTNGVISGSGGKSSVKNSPTKNKNYVSASQGKGIVSGTGFENPSLNTAQHKHGGHDRGGAKASHSISNSSGIVHGGNNSGGVQASHSTSISSGIVHGGGNAYGPSSSINNGKAVGKNKH